MLTSEELKAIRERWLGDEGSSRYRIAQAERDIPALLDTVEKLRGLLRRAWSAGALFDKPLWKEIEEALK